MKIICPNCDQKLIVEKKSKSPFLKCPKCQVVLKLKPSVAKCFHCNNSMHYYKYQFSASKNVCKCANCNGLNRIKT